jgi:hypothetical protein
MKDTDNLDGFTAEAAIEAERDSRKSTRMVQAMGNFFRESDAKKDREQNRQKSRRKP